MNELNKKTLNESICENTTCSDEKKNAIPESKKRQNEKDERAMAESFEIIRKALNDIAQRKNNNKDIAQRNNKGIPRAVSRRMILGVGNAGRAIVSRMIREVKSFKTEYIETGEEIMKVEDYYHLLEGLNTIIIICGIGGKSGTIASAIAKAAKDRKILTISTVFLPFSFESKLVKTKAENDLMEIRLHSHAILEFSNDNALAYVEKSSKAPEILDIFDNEMARMVLILADFIEKIEIKHGRIRESLWMGSNVYMGSAVINGDTSEDMTNALMEINSYHAIKCDISMMQSPTVYIGFYGKFSRDEKQFAYSYMSLVNKAKVFLYDLGNDISTHDRYIRIVAVGLRR